MLPKPTKADRSRPKARRKATAPNLRDFYAFAATFPCVVCGQTPVELHHLAHVPSLKSHEYLPRRKGPAAACLVPLCAAHHRINTDSAHALGDANFEHHHHRVDGWLRFTALALLAAYVTGEE